TRKSPVPSVNSGAAAVIPAISVMASVIKGSGTRICEGTKVAASNGKPNGTGDVPQWNSGNGTGRGAKLSGGSARCQRRNSTGRVPPKAGKGMPGTGSPPGICGERGRTEAQIWGGRLSVTAGPR